MTRKTVLILLVLVAAVVIGAGGYALAHDAENGSTTGQRVNAAIDNLIATGVRLLEVPTFVLLAGIGIVTALVVAVTELFAGKRGRPWLRRAGLILVGVLALFSLALVADHRIAQLQKEVADLRDKLSESRMQAAVPAAEIPTPVVVATAPAAVATAPATVLPATMPVVAATVPDTKPAVAQTKPAATAVASTQRALLFDAEKVKKDLAVFGNVRLRSIIFDQAVDAVDLHLDNPLIQAYVAVVDLKTPGLEIHLGGSLTEKTLTSDFAKSVNASVAINGEAGESPQANSGLGDWTGHFVEQGKVMLTEKPQNRRPFLSFDKENHATFRPLATVDRTVPADGYNVMWGRLDALIDGELETAAERDRQPRTAMAIDKSGDKLYLLVVDGRAPQYSAGVSRGEVGIILRAFGAYNGMLCDEGGSSCMWFKKWGLVNTPSDGFERITYTHFAVSVK